MKILRDKITINITPTAISLVNVDNPSILMTLIITLINIAPRTEPKIVPDPPSQLAPPKHTAAITCNSNATPSIGCPLSNRAQYKTPAIPERRPAII